MPARVANLHIARGDLLRQLLSSGSAAELQPWIVLCHLASDAAACFPSLALHDDSHRAKTECSTLRWAVRTAPQPQLPAVERVPARYESVRC